MHYTAVNYTVHGVKVNSTFYKLLILGLAVSYGALLSQVGAVTHQAYLNYAENSWLILLRYFDRGGVLEVIANEPIWLFLNIALGSFLPPETVIRTIIFASSTVVAWFVLVSNPRHFIWLLLFLLLPSVLRYRLTGFRQGVAIAMFLWAWFSPSRCTRWIMMGLTPFVHASFFIVLPILWTAKVMTRVRLGFGIRTIFFVAMGATAGVGLGVAASFLGARQSATYDFAMTDVSGLGFIFWLVIFGIMALEGRSFLREHAFETGLIIFYLSTYWLIEVTARIFESALLLVLLAGLGLTGWRRFGFLAFVLSFGIMGWIMRVGQPSMGFGPG